MNNPDNQLESSNTLWAPGTVRLEQVTGSTTKAVLQPVPTSDPNDPLNWSSARKTVNFTLVCFYVLWTFVQLSLGFTAWGPLEDELGFTDDQLNSGVAINYGGLALGCIVFIPFIHKYGRRPLYVFSSILQLASVIWQAKTYTIGDYLGSNLISGLGGAISETVVQITIADIFFVHQRAAMSGWYLICVASGSFLGPVASGFIVESQGWRWLWWYCVIFMTINLILVVFFFEESKYVLTRNDRDALRVTTTPGMLSLAESRADDNTTTTPKIGGDLGRNTGEDRRSRIDTSILQKTYFQRIALVTTTPGSIAHYFYQPVVVLFCFPAVTYVAITYGVILASFAIMTAIQSVYLLDPPYNFGPNGIGLMNLAPFLGACIGFAISGFLSDRSIMVLSKRNGGVYEPEMRLWPALVSIMMLPGGILIFGIGLAQGVHWIVLAVGLGLYGFSFLIASDIALAYVTDCYQEIIGDALVGIVFVRNVVSVLALFVLTPWVEAMGVQDVHIITACICFLVLLLPIPLLIWGKRIRTATARRYKRMALQQPTYRPFIETL